MIRPVPVVLGCLAVLLAGTSAAQTPGALPTSPPLPPVQSAPDAGPEQPAEPALPPYEPQLERLAALMGTLAYLRDLCGKGDGAEWRNRMAALLDAEAVTSVRRARLAGAFNDGYRGYEATYRSCTPSAELIIRRFIAEGDSLTRDLSARFGGG